MDKIIIIKIMPFKNFCLLELLQDFLLCLIGIFFSYPASFQTRRWPWEADVRAELHASSLSVWVESVP